MKPHFDYQPRRNHRHDHLDITMLMITIMQIVGFVLSDFPAPSEGNRGYYSKRYRQSVVGGGDGYMSDWNRDWGNLGNPNPGKCIDIPSNMTLCGNIGYDQMRLPNLLEHDTLKEVSQQASSWVRLLAVRCHPDTQVFLCSLFAPVCLERPIWPCRSLCESVKAGCEDRMLMYGFPWPQMLRCDQFPSEDDLCIGLRNENRRDGEEAACPACLSDTFESTVDHYCRAEFVMRIRVKQALVTGSDLKIDSEKKKKIFKGAGPLKTSEMRDSGLFVDRGASCDCPALDTGTGNGGNSSNFIVMGNTVNDRLVLSFVHRIDHKSKEIHRALRVARKPETCTKIAVLEAKSDPAPSEVKKAANRAGKAGNKAKGKKSSHGKETRVKGSSTTNEWKPTTLRSRATTMVAERKTRHPDRASSRKHRKKTLTTDPPLFY